MRCPFAIWRPGPLRKQGYSFYWTSPVLRGLVLHSAEGWRPGMESRLYGPDDASWTFSNYQDGTLEQHYEIGSVLWHCGYPGNLYYDGIEHEGKDQPLTDAQYANTLRLTKWYFEQHPEWGTPELHKNLQEHGWLMATSCPSGRIPWTRLVKDLVPEEEEVSYTPLLIKPVGRKETYVRYGDTLYHVPDPEDFNESGYSWPDVKELPVTDPIWKHRTVYPNGVPVLMLLPGVS